MWESKLDPSHGEVDRGGPFPIETIERLVRKELSYCDENLFQLTNRAVMARREGPINRDELTRDDILLYKYIVKRRNRLKRKLYGL